MAKIKSKPLNMSAGAPVGADAFNRPDRWAWLTHAAFALSIGLVIARATILEIFRNPADVVPGGGPEPRGAGATTTLLLNLLCCLPAILVLARRVLDRGGGYIV